MIIEPIHVAVVINEFVHRKPLAQCLAYSKHSMSTTIVMLSSQVTQWLKKKSASQCRRCRRFRLDPRVRKIPWKGIWQPLQYSCQKNLMNRGAWQAIVHGVANSWILLSDWAHITIILSRGVAVSFCSSSCFWSLIRNLHQWGPSVRYQSYLPSDSTSWWKKDQKKVWVKMWITHTLWYRECKWYSHSGKQFGNFWEN